MVAITDNLSIPDSELEFTFSRSSGPGGQNVNKVSTRVTLLFDVAGSPSLSAEQKRRVFSRLANRVNRHGVLRVVAQRRRTQPANQRDAVDRFTSLMQEALAERKQRRATAVPPKVHAIRLDSKRRRSRVKRLRSKPGADE